MTDITEAPAPTIHETIKDFIEGIVDALDSDAIGSSVEEIPHEYRSGFVPFTDGGWNGTITFDLHSETASSVKLFEKMLQDDYEMACQQWRSDQGLADDAEIDHEDPEWQEFMCDWEHGGDGEDWFVYVRAIRREPGGNSNHKYVPAGGGYEFCLGINDDINYGRDSISWCPGVGSHWIYETETIPYAEITSEKLAEIKAGMLKAWQDS